MSDWISVDDKLPELHGSFLVFKSKSGVDRKVYRIKTGWTMKKIEIAMRDNVTHWMPLPNPPK